MKAVQSSTHVCAGKPPRPLLLALVTRTSKNVVSTPQGLGSLCTQEQFQFAIVLLKPRQAHVQFSDPPSTRLGGFSLSSSPTARSRAILLSASPTLLALRKLHRQQLTATHIADHLGSHDGRADSAAQKYIRRSSPLQKSTHDATTLICMHAIEHCPGNARLESNMSHSST